DSLQVFGGAEPQIDSPHFDFKFQPEEYRRQGSSAAQIEHTHARPQIKIAGQPLGQPQRIGTATATGNYPFGVILVRTWESITEQPSIHRRVHSHLQKFGAL